LRQLIASKQSSYELSGKIEADESYFDGKSNSDIDRERKKNQKLFKSKNNQANGQQIT